MMHHLQLQINDLWQSFFFIGNDDLNASCQTYRELRAALRAAGITHPCRLERVRHNDQRAILAHREAHPEVSAVIDAYCQERYRAGDWTEQIVGENDDLPLGEA